MFLTTAERQQLEDQLDSLKRVVEDFPTAELYIHIHNQPRRREFHVKTNLHLLKQNLFTGERDIFWHPAYERCIRKLVNKVKTLKERLARKATYAKNAGGTKQELRPDREPEIEKLVLAVGDQDYLVFRRVMEVYDESLSRRVRRWIERYPAVNAKLGNEFVLADLVEEVYLNAFEQFSSRPADRIGNWLEHLIDPSVRAFMKDPGTEMENLQFFK
jgi:ribosome-associated translation inhibitor RaiA